MLELLGRRPKGVIGLADAAIEAVEPPKSDKSTRSIRCPVKRSIACIESSSTGVTSVMALPSLPRARFVRCGGCNLPGPRAHRS